MVDFSGNTLKFYLQVQDDMSKSLEDVASTYDHIIKKVDELGGKIEDKTIDAVEKAGDALDKFGDKGAVFDTMGKKMGKTLDPNKNQVTRYQKGLIVVGNTLKNIQQVGIGGFLKGGAQQLLAKIPPHFAAIIAVTGALVAVFTALATEMVKTGAEMFDLFKTFATFTNIDGKNMVNMVEDASRAMTKFGIDIEDVAASMATKIKWGIWSKEADGFTGVMAKLQIGFKMSADDANELAVSLLPITHNTEDMAKTFSAFTVITKQSSISMQDLVKITANYAYQLAFLKDKMGGTANAMASMGAIVAHLHKLQIDMGEVAPIMDAIGDPVQMMEQSSLMMQIGSATGTTANELQKMLKTDPAAFVTKLEQASERWVKSNDATGMSMYMMTKMTGLSSATITKFAQAADMGGDSLEKMNRDAQAGAESTAALDKQYAEMGGTLTNLGTRLKNQFMAIFISKPVIKFLEESGPKFVTTLQNIGEEVSKIVQDQGFLSNMTDTLNKCRDTFTSILEDLPSLVADLTDVLKGLNTALRAVVATLKIGRSFIHATSTGIANVIDSARARDALTQAELAFEKAKLKGDKKDIRSAEIDLRNAQIAFKTDIQKDSGAWQDYADEANKVWDASTKALDRHTKAIGDASKVKLPKPLLPDNISVPQTAYARIEYNQYKNAQEALLSPYRTNFASAAASNVVGTPATIPDLNRQTINPAMATLPPPAVLPPTPTTPQNYTPAVEVTAQVNERGFSTRHKEQVDVLSQIRDLLMEIYLGQSNGGNTTPLTQWER